jgi:hypothetical protein
MIRGKDNDDEGAAVAETAHSPARSPRARRAAPPVALVVSNPTSSVGLFFFGNSSVGLGDGSNRGREDRGRGERLLSER